MRMMQWHNCTTHNVETSRVTRECTEKVGRKIVTLVGKFYQKRFIRLLYQFLKLNLCFKTFFTLGVGMECPCVLGCDAQVKIGRTLDEHIGNVNHLWFCDFFFFSKPNILLFSHHTCEYVHHFIFADIDQPIMCLLYLSQLVHYLHREVNKEIKSKNKIITAPISSSQYQTE